MSRADRPIVPDRPAATEGSVNTDFFEQIADSYESDAARVSNVDTIAHAIMGRVTLHRGMHLMDFGSGTGLLLERIAPRVRKITAVDLSRSMNEQLAQKRDRLDCELDILHLDLTATEIDLTVDGIISSMTLHHVEDVHALLARFHGLLNQGGFIAIADLDREDGSFHTEDTGVHHLGFDRDEISDAARQAGFQEVLIGDASVMEKPQGRYPIFLLSARK